MHFIRGAIVLSRTLLQMRYRAIVLAPLLLCCQCFPLPAFAIELPEVVHQTMEIYFEKPDVDKQLAEIVSRNKNDLRYKRKAGVFVTLSRNGKSRACWGSVDPDGPDLVQATIHATLEALTNEYRYKPVSSSEWRKLKAQVTVVNDVEPIADIHGINPWRDGLMVRSNGKSGVLLPGEASDAFYELVRCKLKAGIQAGEPCQLFRLKAQIYE
jgi:AMMECR1 domain-containing protein